MAKPKTDILPPHMHRGIAAKEIPWKWMPSLVFADSLPVATILLALTTLRRFGLGNGDITFYLAVICLPLVLRPWARLMTERIMASPKAWIVATELVGAASLWATGYTLQSKVWIPCTIGFLTLGSFAAAIHSATLGCHYTASRHENGTGTLFRLRRTVRAIALMCGAGVLTMMGGNLEVMRRNIPYSWASVFYLLAALTAACCLYHFFVLPSSAARQTDNLPAEIASGHSTSGVGVFLLMTAESLFMGVGLLFLIDAVHNGGQGLSPQEFGLAVGTTGVAATAAGTIGTDLLLRRKKRLGKAGLLAGTVAVQCLLFLLMNTAAPMSLTAIIFCMVCIGICHGAGFVGLLTLLQRHGTESATDTSQARKASATLLAATLALMISGTMEESMGYTTFFATILCVCTAAAAVSFLLERKAGTAKADGE